MVIKKQYKFYAAHRNQELINSSCFSIHGHSYFLYISFNVKRTGNITTLFADFDDKIEPWLKKNFDHSFMIDVNDTFAETLKRHKRTYNEDMRLLLMPFPTSVENLSFFIFNKLVNEFKFDVKQIELQETTSSTLIYNMQDFEDDMESSLGDSLCSFEIQEIL